MVELKKAVRTAQTFAAPLLEFKALTQQTMRRLMRIPSEPSYKAFGAFTFEKDAQFLDIGGNRGQTIQSFRLYNESAPVASFEPNPVLAGRLEKRYTSQTNTKIYPFGLGAENGFFELYIPYYRGFMFDGLASFDWVSAHNWLNADRLYGFDERHLEIKEVRCEIRKWDEVETSPALVKIDVQGFESNVLKGGITTIRNFRPVFLIENSAERHHEDVLFPEGYRRAGYADGHFILDKVGSGNTYYLPEEKIGQFNLTHS